MNKIFIILLLIPCYLSAQDQQLEKYIDSLMAPVNRSTMPASLLIIAKDGKPLVRKAYGMTNLEMGVPAAPEHLFTLASVNKQMIAVCILQLAQQGKLKLTDDIRSHLPTFNTHGQLITVEQLLNHTSGINSINSPARGKSFFDQGAESGILSDREFLDYAMQQPLLFKPGTDWSWNTWAYHIAFFIVEKVSGLPFNEYVRKNLFQPAGMSNSFSKVDGNRLGLNGIKNLNSSFYYPDVDGKLVWRDTRRLTPYFFYQRYSIVTCLDDLVKWDVALREGKLLPMEWLQKAWTAGVMKDGRATNYGLGWVVSEQDGYRLMSHIGIGTNPICVVHVPQEQLYIAYTQFFGSYGQTEMQVKKILSRLLPLSYPTPAKAEAPLTDYIGAYQIHRNGLDIATQISDMPVYIRITASGDTLYLQQTASEKIMLRPAGKDRFLPTGSENTWHIFIRDESGKVNAITTRGSFWTYGPEVRNKRINKVWPQPVTSKAVPEVLLKKYSGIYYMAPFDSYVVIETDGVKLFSKTQGRQQELIPIADNKFVRKGAEEISFEFKSATNGSIALTVSGLRSLDYSKIN
jgi:CubicO group peptidase (beta-lactamase class C family)